MTHAHNVDLDNAMCKQATTDIDRLQASSA